MSASDTTQSDYQRGFSAALAIATEIAADVAYCRERVYREGAQQVHGELLQVETPESTKSVVQAGEQGSRPEPRRKSDVEGSEPAPTRSVEQAALRYAQNWTHPRLPEAEIDALKHAFLAGAAYVTQPVLSPGTEKILELAKEIYDAEMRWTRKGVQPKSEWCEEYEAALSCTRQVSQTVDQLKASGGVTMADFAMVLRDRDTLLDAVRFYAGKTGESEWDGSRFLAFDKFGAICPEIGGPKVASDALKTVNLDLVSTAHEDTCDNCGISPPCVGMCRLLVESAQEDNNGKG